MLLSAVFAVVSELGPSTSIVERFKFCNTPLSDGPCRIKSEIPQSNGSEMPSRRERQIGLVEKEDQTVGESD